jgi:colicin import membrane protein
MSASSPRFGVTFGVVTITHIVVLALLVIATASSCIMQKNQPKIMPVEFMVAVDDGPLNTEVANPDVKEPPPPEVKEPPKPAPEPEPVKAIIPEPKKPEPKKPEPKKPDPPKPEPKKPEPKKSEPKKPEDKKPIVKGRRITAPNPNPPPPNAKRLSQEELARLLAMGATAGNRNLTPEGDSLYFEVIRRKLYKAWVQPGSVPSQLTAEVEITMNAAGDIMNRRMLRGSGNAVMDASVMDAVRSVLRIDGLSKDFIESKRGRVTITFELSAGTA